MNLYNNELYMEDIHYVGSLSLPWEKLKGKSLMLSGATGMIGSFLVDVILERNITDNLNCTVYALGRNKEKAMEILRGKLVQMQLEQHAENLSELRAGESAGWGQQIRNYVLQPYKLVKDTRTGYEETDPNKVLDGEIEGFIDAFLEQ